MSKEVSFLCSATTASQYPSHLRTEVALAGRSNVGKSSLINAITGVRGLARTAKRPGRTQTINFYALTPELSLVDLPGYGYAEVPERIRASWGPMIENYLMQREQLGAIILLVDSRHGPTKDDLSLWEWMANLPLATFAVASKWDKVKRSGRHSRMNEMERQLGVRPLPVSSVTGDGINELNRLLRNISSESSDGV